MSTMVNASRPWTVRTTKRKLFVSTASPRKRHRSLGDAGDGRPSVLCNPRQQTLTQIQFVPRHSRDDRDDNLRPLVPRKQNDVRLQQQSRTLTQMDFVAPSAIHQVQKLDLTPIRDANDAEVSDVAGNERLFIQLDGSRDAPNFSWEKGTRIRGKATSKKGTPGVSQESQEFQPPRKRRKISNNVAADALEHIRRSSSRAASAKATRSIALLSARSGGDQRDGINSLESPSTRSNAAILHAQGSVVALRGSFSPTPDQEKRRPPQHRLTAESFPRTPSRRKEVVPSSQSPEDLIPDTETTCASRVSRVLLQERTPLKERSANAKLSWLSKDDTESSSERMHGPSPLKWKTSASNLSRKTLEQERVSIGNGKAFQKRSIWSPLSSSPRAEKSEKPVVVQVPQVKYSAATFERKHLEQPLRGPPPKARHSREEDELEMSGTSRVDHRRDPSSSPDSVELRETPPGPCSLLGLRCTPQGASPLQETDGKDRPRSSNVSIQDFAMDNCRWSAPQSHKEGVEQDKPPYRELERAVSVADSQEGEGSVLTLSPGSSIANDTLFNAELAERIATSSADASPRQGRSVSPSFQLNHEIGLSLPGSNMVHQLRTYSTTKTVPLNDAISSPSLPSLPPRRSQGTVCPASLPRPSQVSTQDPTQLYQSMSSMPLAPSSPTRSGPPVITIKSSSSIPGPLGDIPLQAYSRSESNGHLVLNDCLDTDDNASLSGEPAGMSGRIAGEMDGLEESQIVSLPMPVEIPRSHNQGQQKPETTEQGSQVRRRRRPRKPVIPPEVREVLGESLLESVPGPPGWSQRSWDDEPL